MDLTNFKLLVVDDEAPIRSMIRQIIQRKGFECLVAVDGEEALKIMEETSIDVVITDVNMPGMNGIDLTRKIKEHYDSDVIIMTGFTADFSYENVVVRGASDFFAKPVTPDELTLRVQRVLRERTILAERNRAEQEHIKALEKLKRAVGDIIYAMTKTMETRDPYTAGHQHRVSALALAVGKEVGLTGTRLEGVGMGGVIHDLGKISLPSEILSKPGRLTDIEYSMMKAHPKVGYDILKNIEFPWPLAEITLQHHERLDGSGYPCGLTGDEIILEAKIMAVADVVEAMASHRPYRGAVGVQAALDYITERRGTGFDPDSVDACVRVFGEGNFVFRK